MSRPSHFIVKSFCRSRFSLWPVCQIAGRSLRSPVPGTANIPDRTFPPRCWRALYPLPRVAPTRVPTVRRGRDGACLLTTTLARVSAPTSVEVAPDFSNCQQHFFELRFFRSAQFFLRQFFLRRQCAAGAGCFRCRRSLRRHRWARSSLRCHNVWESRRGRSRFLVTLQYNSKRGDAASTCRVLASELSGTAGEHYGRSSSTMCSAFDAVHLTAGPRPF